MDVSFAACTQRGGACVGIRSQSIGRGFVHTCWQHCVLQHCRFIMVALKCHCNICNRSSRSAVSKQQQNVIFFAQHG